MLSYLPHRKRSDELPQCRPVLFFVGRFQQRLRGRGAWAGSPRTVFWTLFQLQLVLLCLASLPCVIAGYAYNPMWWTLWSGHSHLLNHHPFLFPMAGRCHPHAHDYVSWKSEPLSSLIGGHRWCSSSSLLLIGVRIPCEPTPIHQTRRPVSLIASAKIFLSFVRKS